MLEDFREIEIVGEASHGREALELTKKLKPDLIFLDIEMPNLNGIEVAEKVLKNGYKPYIVFVTAYEKYALDAFEVEAMDYILKPICEERLEKGMERILERIKIKNIGAGNKNIYPMNRIGFRKSEFNNKICVTSNGKLIPLDLEEIIYATVEDKNTVIFSRRGKFEVNYTLSELEENLGPMFFRSHRSYLINLDHIELIEPWFNSTFNLILRNIDIKVPVSRSQSKEFKKLMNIH